MLRSGWLKGGWSGIKPKHQHQEGKLRKCPQLVAPSNNNCRITTVGRMSTQRFLLVLCSFKFTSVFSMLDMDEKKQSCNMAVICHPGSLRTHPGLLLQFTVSIPSTMEFISNLIYLLTFNTFFCWLKTAHFKGGLPGLCDPVRVPCHPTPHRSWAPWRTRPTKCRKSRRTV